MPRKMSPRLCGGVVPELSHLLLRVIRTADEQGNRCWAPCLLLGNGAGPGPLPSSFLIFPFFQRGPNWPSRPCSCVLNPLDKSGEHWF